ncbi:hypothetical protein CWO07_13275 [Vibrio splendidus]|uniref:Uncharacterized protein n=1 Tax=Vibrio splendidus TaxID=29497 RepID=A0A0P6YMG6_VIBSP|nr:MULTISPECIES: hypothetical protein [Vibrio]OEE51507.1 hypothetical protein A147_06200 [Vibrio splendidus FF-6]OEE53208.1 hypothetical protein A146_08550 [Vibrio splendidus FF-500]HAS25243.1 hypothetical protein [Vibrio sp.]KPM00524.1 hypothetical protein AN167_07945 [Vibrio splendidus]MBB1464718.1 hypothetical protein [Vibrio sp. SG41-7]
MCGDKLNATAIIRTKGISQPVLGAAKVSIFELRLHELELGDVNILDASKPKILAYRAAIFSEEAMSV